MPLETNLSNNQDSHSNNFFELTGFDFIQCNGFEEVAYIWGVCMALCFALGLPASVTILWEMFKTYRRGSPFTPNEFFILNLSIMDFVFIVFIPPGFFNHFIFRNRLYERIWDAVFSFNFCGRPLLTSCICLDCYLAVVHPITYHKIRSLTPRVVMASIVWALTVTSGIAYIFVKASVIAIIVSVPFIIAIVIIVLCDSFIIHTLMKSNRDRKNIHPQKQRAIHTIINSFFMAVVSYLPPVILYLIGIPLISDQNIFLCTISVLTAITSTSGSTGQPLLYLYYVGKLDYFRLGCCKKT